MRNRAVLLAVVIAVSGAAVSAHHSVAASYDTGKLVSLAGVIGRVQLVNPHVKLELTGTGPDGAETTWTIEMAPPNALKLHGFDLSLLKTGQSVVIESWLQKNGTNEATGRTLVMPDGRRFDIGDSLNQTLRSIR
jgi:hypothetical protein